MCGDDKMSLTPEQKRENHRKSSEKWRATNPEKYLKWARAYYLNHKEQCSMNSKEWRKNNRDYMLQYGRIYYENNKDECLKNSGNYYKEHKKELKEYGKNYRKDHKTEEAERKRIWRLKKLGRWLEK